MDGYITVKKKVYHPVFFKYQEDEKVKGFRVCCHWAVCQYFPQIMETYHLVHIPTCTIFQEHRDSEFLRDQWSSLKPEEVELLNQPVLSECAVEIATNLPGLLVKLVKPEDKGTI